MRSPSCSSFVLLFLLPLVRWTSSSPFSGLQAAMGASSPEEPEEDAAFEANRDGVGVIKFVHREPPSSRVRRDAAARRKNHGCDHATNKQLCLPPLYSKFELPFTETVNVVEIGIEILDVLRINDKEYSVTFSSYFNVLWKEPRLRITDAFFKELNFTDELDPEALHPVNLELVNDLWLPNIFIYNLKTFKVVEVLSKHAGLWINANHEILYSQATHITFICPMRFDSFPLDTQTCKFQVGSYSYDDTKMIFVESPRVKGYEETSRSIVLDYDVHIAPLRTDDRTLIYGNLGNYSLAGFEMILHRYVSHYIITYYLPSGLFVVVSWISFVVPPEVIPGRMALLITLFLVLVNIFNSVTTNTPKAEGLTAIEAWMLACILFVFGALVEYAVILFRRQTGTDDHRDPLHHVRMRAQSLYMGHYPNPSPPHIPNPGEMMQQQQATAAAGTHGNNMQSIASTNPYSRNYQRPNQQYETGFQVAQGHATQQPQQQQQYSSPDHQNQGPQRVQIVLKDNVKYEITPYDPSGMFSTNPANPASTDSPTPPANHNNGSNSSNNSNEGGVASPLPSKKTPPPPPPRGRFITPPGGSSQSTPIQPTHQPHPHHQQQQQHHQQQLYSSEDRLLEPAASEPLMGSNNNNVQHRHPHDPAREIFDDDLCKAGGGGGDGGGLLGRWRRRRPPHNNLQRRQQQQQQQGNNKKPHFCGDNYLYVDRFFLVAMPMLFLVFNVVYWFYYGRHFFLATQEEKPEAY